MTSQELIKEVTNKLNEELKFHIGVDIASINLTTQGIKGMTEETKTLVKEYASAFVSGVQLTRLTEVLNILKEEAFDNKQSGFYILIDKLDENWSSTKVRYQFIRALIEETKTMRIQLPQVKIISSLRDDLLEAVYEKTRDSGFQIEKYEAYVIKIKWTKSELKEILSTRIAEVYKRQYQKQSVKFGDIFPNNNKYKTNTLDYIIDRTLHRPRDVIHFTNECFSAALENETISWKNILTAEKTYSSKRLKSLITEEWSDSYPSLSTFIEIIRGITIPFSRSSINNDDVIKIGSATLSEESEEQDEITVSIDKYMDSKATVNDVIFLILKCFYHVGLIGIKNKGKNRSYIWAHIDDSVISKNKIMNASEISVHKMFREALEIEKE